MNVFLKTFLITLFVFSLGLLLGLQIGKEKISSIEEGMYSLRSDIENVELEFLFLNTMGNNISCNYFNEEAIKLGEESGKLGKKVEEYESSRKLDESSFKAQKSKYMLILIRDWLVIEKIKQNCQGDYITVLYFYSNKNCEKCNDQGIILTYFKEKLEDNLQIFAIDSDLDLTIIKALKESYKVNEYPTLIINGKPYYGFLNKTNLKEIFCKENNELSIC